MNFHLKGTHILWMFCVALTICSCKKNEEKLEDIQFEESLEEPIKKELELEPKLELGCYTYEDNSNRINLEITKIDNPVEGNLTFDLAGKSQITGVFNGEFKERILYGTYTFQSDSQNNKKDMIFMLKGNQLIEGQGGLNKSGTKFNEAKKVSYDSKMPLTKTNCVQ
jgi:hypothetical protein